MENMKNKGFIYIMLLPGKKRLKIGKTKENSDNRRKQLEQQYRTNTGTDANYELAFDIEVEDTDAIESAIHSKLDKFRYFKNEGRKEFFDLYLNDAIKALFQVIEDYEKQLKISYEKSQKGKTIEHWNKLSRIQKRFLLQQINIDKELTNLELKECLRNIIEYSTDIKERSMVLDLYSAYSNFLC